jgi:hypothetical protein
VTDFGAETPVAEPIMVGRSPSWSPDDTHLVLSTTALNRPYRRVVKVNLETREATLLGGKGVPDWKRGDVSVSCESHAECDDLNECTIDSCDPATWTCSYSSVDDSTPCDGVAAICCGGSCIVPCVSELDCDDADLCTDDSCAAPGSCDANCEHIPNDEPACCVPTHSKEKGPRCSDGIDNDCDGMIDGDDPDC